MLRPRAIWDVATSRYMGCGVHAQCVRVDLLADTATHPLAFMPFRVRLVARLPLYPQRVGRIRKAAKAATTPLSRRLAGPGLQRRRFALKDYFQYPLEGYSDPLWAEAHVESYAADTRPDAPSGASNCGF